MASNAGKLCWTGSGSLAYKYGGSALIYKAESSSADVTIRIPWTPQSYTCKTYQQYHIITFNCSGSFSSGSGTVVSKVEGGTEVVFTIKVTSGPATFRITTGCSMDCSSSEDPGVTCRVLANQQGATPKAKSGVKAPRSSTVSTNVNFDANKKLTGIS